MTTPWTVRSLWVGPPLTELEWACLTSFVHHGARVELFSDDLARRVPSGVILRDARPLIGTRHLRYGPRSGKHAGSFAFAADIARLRTLDRDGGWWVDADVMCLRSFAPIDFGFRAAWETPIEPERSGGLDRTKGGVGHGPTPIDSPERRVNVAVMRAPRGHVVVRKVLQRALYPWLGSPWDEPLRRLWNVWAYRDTLRDPGNVPWGHTAGPKALTHALDHYHLASLVMPRETFYPITWEDWRQIPTLSNDVFHALATTSYAVHLWADEYRIQGVDRGRAIREAAWAAAYLAGFTPA